jgi:hypothetical protein
LKVGTLLSIAIIVLALFGALLVLRPRLEFVDLLVIIVIAFIQIGLDIAERRPRPVGRAEAPPSA